MTDNCKLKQFFLLMECEAILITRSEIRLYNVTRQIYKFSNSSDGWASNLSIYCYYNIIINFINPKIAHANNFLVKF